MNTLNRAEQSKIDLTKKYDLFISLHGKSESTKEEFLRTFLNIELESIIKGLASYNAETKKKYSERYLRTLKEKRQFENLLKSL